MLRTEKNIYKYILRTPSGKLYEKISKENIVGNVKRTDSSINYQAQVSENRLFCSDVKMYNIKL